MKMQLDYRVTQSRGQPESLPPGAKENIYGTLELRLGKELAKLLTNDGKTRCVQMRRSQTQESDDPGCPVFSLALGVEAIVGFLNFTDAEVGELVHHSGILSAHAARIADCADPAQCTELLKDLWSSRLTRLSLPKYGHMVEVEFERISETWWKRVW